MKLSLSCLVLASCFAATTYAHAVTITSATVYTGIPDSGNADDTANKTATHANFTIGGLGINFNSPPQAYTVATFLNSPTFSGGVGGFDATKTAGDIEVIITGSITLKAGDKLTVTHDDGADLYLGALEVITAPGATVSHTDSYTELTAGTYAFTLNYAENGFPPADLNFSVNGTTVAPTPEPSSLILLGTGLATAAGFARRRFSRSV